MNLITSTQLRTQTSRLIEAVLAGNTVDLIHRSKIIGEFRPKMSKVKVFNAARMEKIVKKLNLPHLSYAEREKRYRKAMEKKHGPSVH